MTTTWMAVVDRRTARLFEARRLPTGRLHLDTRGEVREHWDEKLHQRPSILSAHGRTMASHAHEEEERLRRFGRQVARWLEESLRLHALPRLSVFCAPAMLGRLRLSLPPSLLARLDLREDDLAGLTPGELAAHGTVRAALSEP
jgi:protein required for attachment to host cells